MVNFQEIPQQRWPQFFDQFNKDHEGWCATIELQTRDLKCSKMADNVPISSITCDGKDSTGPAIEVSAATDNASVFNTHVIHRARKVRMSDESADRVDLEIEAADGRNTLIHLMKRPEVH